MQPANRSKGDGVMLFRESETIELKEVVADERAHVQIWYVKIMAKVILSLFFMFFAHKKV